MTSGMMKALEAGGMEACYSKQRDEIMNSKFGDADYVPNESYMELDAEVYRTEGFPLQFEGKLIKILWGGVLRLPAVDGVTYKILMMTRPQEEIRKSLIAFFGTDEALRKFGNSMESVLKLTADILRDRKSVESVDVLNANHVATQPLLYFTHLAAGGWPIDPEKASKVIDRTKLRFSGEGAAYPAHAL